MDTMTQPDSAAIDPDGMALRFVAARLWERQGRDGFFLSGVMGNVRVLVCRNEPNDRDDAGWVLVFAPNNRPQPRKPRRTP